MREDAGISRRGFLARALAAGAAVAGGPGLLAACGGGSAGGGSKTALNVGLGLDITDLNGFDLALPQFPVLASMYDTLIGYDGKGRAVPRLAESWHVAEDHASLQVKLRKGLTFHNGEPLDAQAVVTNMQKARDVTIGVQVYGMMPFIKDMSPVDEQTVSIALQGPTPTEVVTDILFSMNLMAPSALNVDQLKHHAVGAGPFQQVSYTPGSALSLKRFDGWWRKPGPSLEKLTFHLSSDYDSLIASLQGGDLDMIPFIPPNYAVKVKDQYDILSGPVGLDVFPIRLNPSRDPFQSKLVRQGMMHAIDRAGIVKQVFQGYSKPTVLLFGESGSGFDASALGKYPFDLKKAKQMFEAGGQPGWSAVIYVGNSDTVGQAIVQIVQADLAKIGVKMTPQLVGPTESAAHAYSGDFQMTFGELANNGKYPTWVTLNSLLRVEGNPVMTGSAAPILARWRAAIDQANAALTADAQSKAFATLREVQLDESWVIPICQSESLVAMSKKLSGASINRNDFVVYDDVKASQSD